MPSGVPVTRAGQASKAAAWKGLRLPTRKAPPSSDPPWPSYQGCPPNPRPRMFNQQIHFHRGAAGFESLLLKSKQNTEALPTSLRGKACRLLLSCPGEELLSPSCGFLCFTAFSRIVFFRPSESSASGLCLLRLHRLCPRGGFPRQAWGLHSLDWGRDFFAGAEGHFATWWGWLSPPLIQQIFIESL